MGRRIQSEFYPTSFLLNNVMYILNDEWIKNLTKEDVYL
ncbi:hypothetical protein SHOMR3_1423 [Staphylococcus hominis]|nr:hypothetical protein SHOMR3_1423 [Staphylococcus hominis]KMU59619.1 hypothetical protein SHOMR1_0639 [Staphylococcus hominis]KMU60453.1 hypothetical protein SHOMR2_0464 [Staphylococcus hominis]